MSRSDYSDDCDGTWRAIMWRGTVASSIRGKRGQAFLIDLLAALDAMTDKVLMKEGLEDGANVCAIGSLGRARGLDMSALDPEASWDVAKLFDIADPLAREVAYMNDEAGWWQETPGQTWRRMRAWVASQIKQAPTPAGAA